MIFSPQQLETFLAVKIENFAWHKDNIAYSGCTFCVGSNKIAFRKAKVTPKKIGAFVAIWDKSVANKNVPLASQNLDYLLIACEDGVWDGLFVFPKAVLLEKNIISENGNGGKLGFRVYPPWVSPDNAQAIDTQKWQMAYFVDLDKPESNDFFKRIAGNTIWATGNLATHN